MFGHHARMSGQDIQLDAKLSRLLKMKVISIELTRKSFKHLGNERIIIIDPVELV